MHWRADRLRVHPGYHPVPARRSRDLPNTEQRPAGGDTRSAVAPPPSQSGHAAAERKRTAAEIRPPAAPIPQPEPECGRRHRERRSAAPATPCPTTLARSRVRAPAVPDRGPELLSDAAHGESLGGSEQLQHFVIVRLAPSTSDR